MAKNTKCLFKDGQELKGLVSVSQLQTFMSCPKKWQYGYVENLTPRIERPYLSIGKLCHKGMQTAMTLLWQEQKKPSGSTNWCREILDASIEAINAEWQEYFNNTPYLPEEIPDLEQIRWDAVDVFTQAFWEFDINKYEVLSVYKNGVEMPALELHFMVPCAGSKGLHGYIDAILKDKETGCTWSTDYKFRKSLSPDDEEATNIQNAVYTYACRKMGIEITGTMTWQHCNTPAAEPSLNKNGTVSRAKIKTTWAKYAAFCEGVGVNPEEYREEMQEKLADIEWYRATYEYRNEIFTKNVWNEVVVPAAYEIKSAYGKATKGKNKPRVYPWNCKMCQYQSLCQAELRGYDVDAIKLRDYTKRERKTTDDNGTDDIKSNP